MSRSPRRLALLAAAGAAVLALAGCGAGSPSGGTDPYAGSASAGHTELTPPEGTILSANSTAQLGTVVVDGLGWTLYRFDDDSAEPPTATCADACARTWPPVLAEPGSPLSVEGIPQEAVGTVMRPDGAVQLTIGGWPVYRYAEDSAPGATDGNGVDGAWFAVTPDGGRATAP